MPAFNAQSFYNPSVDPSTGEGLARGISAFGASVAGGISKYQDNKQAKAERTEDRQWQLDDRQDQRKYNDDQKKYVREQEEQAMLDQANGKATAIAHTYGMSPETIEALKTMDAKTKNSFLDHYGQVQFSKFRNDQEMQQAKQKQQIEIDGNMQQMQAEDAYSKANPRQWTQIPGSNYLSDGRQIIPQQTAPQGQQQYTQADIDKAIQDGAEVTLGPKGASIRYPARQQQPVGRAQGSPASPYDDYLKK